MEKKRYLVLRGYLFRYLVLYLIAQGTRLMAKRSVLDPKRYQRASLLPKRVQAATRAELKRNKQPEGHKWWSDGKASSSSSSPSSSDYLRLRIDGISL